MSARDVSLDAISLVLLYGYYRVPTVRELNVRGNLLKTPHVAKFFNIGFRGTVARPFGLSSTASGVPGGIVFEDSGPDFDNEIELFFLKTSSRCRKNMFSVYLTFWEILTNNVEKFRPSGDTGDMSSEVSCSRNSLCI